MKYSTKIFCATLLVGIGLIGSGLLLSTRAQKELPAGPMSYRADGHRIMKREGQTTVYAHFRRFALSTGEWRLENTYYNPDGTIDKTDLTICRPDEGVYAVFPDRLEYMGPCRVEIGDVEAQFRQRGLATRTFFGING